MDKYAGQYCKVKNASASKPPATTCAAGWPWRCAAS